MSPVPNNLKIRNFHHNLTSKMFPNKKPIFLKTGSNSLCKSYFHILLFYLFIGWIRKNEVKSVIVLFSQEAHDIFLNDNPFQSAPLQIAPDALHCVAIFLHEHRLGCASA